MIQSENIYLSMLHSEVTHSELYKIVMDDKGITSAYPYFMWIGGEIENIKRDFSDCGLSSIPVNVWYYLDKSEYKGFISKDGLTILDLPSIGMNKTISFSNLPYGVIGRIQRVLNKVLLGQEPSPERLGRYEVPWYMPKDGKKLLDRLKD